MQFGGELLYYLAPPAREGARDARLERFLDQVRGPLERIVYLSTTGVYGDRQGAWVNEDTSPAPQTARAVRRLAAENALRGWAEARAVSWCILRVAGIYGPGRLPLERLRRGEPAISPQEATPTNRIHVEDLATSASRRALAAAADGRIYNVADGTDDSLTSYLQRVARIGGLPQPPLISRAEARATLFGVFMVLSRRIAPRRQSAPARGTRRRAGVRGFGRRYSRESLTVAGVLRASTAPENLKAGFSCCRAIRRSVPTASSRATQDTPEAPERPFRAHRPARSSALRANSRDTAL